MKYILFIVLMMPTFASAQKVSDYVNFGTRKPIIVNIQTTFGANPNDNLDDTWAFIKASMWMQNLWDANGTPYTKAQRQANAALNINYNTHFVRLEIPTAKGIGVYLVGKQVQINNVLFNKKKIETIDVPYPSGVDMVQPLLPYYYAFNSSNSSTYPLDTIAKFKVATFAKYYYKKQGASIIDSIKEHLPKDAKGNPLRNHINYCTSFETELPIFSIKPMYDIDSSNVVNGIQIVGTNPSKNKNSRPILKYNDGLSFGFRDSKGKSFSNKKSQYSAGANTYGGGTAFGFMNVSNIILDSIIIDGNNINKKEMGGWMDGNQMGSSGVGFFSCKNVVMRHVESSNHDIDGLSFCDAEYNPHTPTNWWLDHFVGNYNGRNCLSLLGQRNFLISHCDILNTGQAINKLSGKIIRQDPASGIDFECSEQGEFGETSNGRFVDCKIVNSAAFTVINDIAVNYFTDKKSNKRVYYTKNIQFDSCFFWEKSAGMKILGDQFRFNDCYFGTAWTDMGRGDLPEDGFRFTRCKFSDAPYQGMYWIDGGGQKMSNGKVDSAGLQLIKNGITYFKNALLMIRQGFSKNVKFDDCTFEVNDPHRLITIGDFTIKDIPISAYARYKNCSFFMNNFSLGLSFLYDSNTKHYRSGDKFGNRFINTVFDGKTFFSHKYNDEESKHNINLENVYFAGSNTAKNPNLITTNGRINFNIYASQTDKNTNMPTDNVLVGYNLISGADDGFTQLNFGSKSLLEYVRQYQKNARMTIGKNAVLRFEHNASFSSVDSGYLALAGKLLIESGSYFCTGNLMIYKPYSAAKPSIFIHKNAIIGEDNYWQNAYRYKMCLATNLFNFKTLIDGIKLETDHPAIRSNPSFDAKKINGKLH
jgi:hypothetical protein